VRTGRPDLVAVVCSRAKDVAQTGVEKQLVVAACGPARLVEAARAAAAIASKECPDVRVEFSGSDSRW